MGQNKEEHQNLINTNNNTYYNNGGYYIPPPQQQQNYITSITPTTTTTTTTNTTTNTTISSLPVIGIGNKYKINNSFYNHNNKLIIEKDINNFFLPNLPPPLYSLISEHDYCEIIKQLNHYKQGIRIPKVYNLITILVCLIILGFIIYINLSVSLVGFSLLPILLVVIFIHIFSYSRAKKIFNNETKKYIEAVNKHYGQHLSFNPIYNKDGLTFNLEVYYSINNNNINFNNNNNNNNLSTPPNIYSNEMFYNFKYLQYVKPQNIVYYNGYNNNASISNIDIIDINNNESQVQPSLQQKLIQQQIPQPPEVLDTRPTQFYINNTSYYADDIKRPSIDELLTPSSAETYYTGASSSSQK